VSFGDARRRGIGSEQELSKAVGGGSVRVPWAHQLRGSVSKLGAVTALVPVDPLKGAGVYVLQMLPYLQRTKQPGEDGADMDLVFVSSVIPAVQPPTDQS
jgi:hypothetical protein